MSYEESKKDKQKKNFLCPLPFKFVEIHPNGNVYPCHHALDFNYVIGNIFEEDFESIWNGEKSQEFRRSIIEQDYSHCHPERCHEPVWHDEDYLYKKVMPQFPEMLEINPDYACNVRCIICRETFNKADEKTVAKWEENIDKIVLPMLKDAKIFYTSGLGEPFVSPVTEKIIKRVGEFYPDIKFNISSNGIFFDKEHCDRLGITDRLYDVDISVHAATEETYNKIVKGGNFKKLQENVKWLAGKFHKGEINYLRINFVVMQNNYKEMKLFQEWANSLGIYTCFWEYRKWGDSLEVEKNYDKVAVFNKEHPEHQEFLKIVQDPIFNENCDMNDEIKGVGE